MTASPSTNLNSSTGIPVDSGEAIGTLAPAATAAPTATPTTGATLGTLSNATAGVTVIRGDKHILVKNSQTLQEGDRVTVPEGGHAWVKFPESANNSSLLAGKLTGGSDAIITLIQLSGGRQDVDIDLVAGDLVMDSPYADGNAVTVEPNQTVASASGIGLDEFLLAGIGVAALAAVLSSSGNDDSSVNTFNAGASAAPVSSTSNYKSASETLHSKGTPDTSASTVAPGAATPSTAVALNPSSNDNSVRQLKTSDASGTHTESVPEGGVLLPTDSDSPNSAHTLASHVIAAPDLALLDSQFAPLASEIYSSSHSEFVLLDSTLVAAGDRVVSVLTPVVDGILGTGATVALIHPLEPQIHALSDSPLLQDLSFAHVNVLVGGELNVSPLAPVAGVLAVDLTVGHLVEPITALHSVTAGLTPLPVAVSDVVASVPVASVTTPVVVDMLHVALIMPITSTVESAGSTGSQTPVGHVLQGLLA